MATIVPSSTMREAMPSSLEVLQNELANKTPLLARNGDADLAKAALQVVKDIFDLGLEYEQLSHPHIQPFIISTLEPPTIDTRSKAKAKPKGKGKANGTATDPEEEYRIDPNSVLPYTPLSTLTLEGMDLEQIWAQLELRNEPMVKLVKEVAPVNMEPGTDEEDASSDDEDDMDSDDSMEDMTEEEFREMMMRGGLGDSEDDEDEDDDSEDEDESDDEVAFYDENEEGEDEEEDDDGEFAPRQVSEDDELDLDEDEDEDEGDEIQTDEDGDEEDGDLEDDEEEEDLEDQSDEGEVGPLEADEMDDRTLLFGDQPGPSHRSRRRHPTLDDDFFSIDQFNRETEEAEAGRVSSGRLGGDGEDEEDLDEDIGGLLLSGGDQAERDLMYSDFFAPPRGAGRGKAKAPVKSDPKGKGKQKVHFDASDAEEEHLEEEDEEGGRDVMGRFKGDLFDDDDEEEEGQTSKNLSTHEKQQLALAKQIAELEQEAVGPKDWTLLGEATSRSRPENSLLEEDLDFEQVAKVTPVMTEETVKTLEEMIKKRIIDNNFDSPVRVRAYEPTPFLPSRYFELQDTQSSKSLAQIYEDEYQAAAAGGKARDPRDEKLRKEHEAIDKLWEDICYKLDALSSLNFVPKQPKAQITTVDNLPTTSLESALPPTSSATTLLAPEELFAAPPASASVARSELTPEQAQAARTKRRKTKQGERRRLDEMAELYGRKRGKKGKAGVRQEKEQALKGLVKSGKGVTVVGRGSGSNADKGNLGA